MKKAILLLLLTTAFSVKSHSAVFTSIATGNYHAASTWSFTGSDADGIPDLDDNVTITSGKTVTLTGTENCKTLTINPGGIINLNLNTMRVYGDFTNNGTSTGSGSWQFRAAGTYSGNNLPNNGTVYFYAPYSIAAGVVMSKPGYMVVSASVILSNFGNVTLTAGSIQLLSGAKWINKSGSTVSVSTNVISSGTIDASAASNNFIYTGGGTTTVQATNATYYNLILSSGAGANTKALNGNLTVLNNLNINSNATLNWNNKNITLGGNWVNNANTACTNMATITFNGSGTQTITRSSQEFFNNVTLSGSGTVSIATNVRADGTTTLSSGTLDPGAFFYKQAGISWLNNGGAINTAATGSVLFNATVNQTIGGTTSTTFGNFGINNSGGSVILALNQTVTGVTTLLSGILDVSSFSFNQSGSTFSFSGGTLNTAATGKVVFTGSSAQTITSAATPSFGNVEINSSSTVTPATDVIVLGTTTMTSGTLDPSTFTWHQQGTSWVGNGGSVNAAASGEVVFDGAVNQTIGGSTGTTFGNLEFNNAGHSITLSVNSGGAATTLLTAGTFDVSTFSFSQSGDTWSATGGTLNTGASGKVIFTGAGTQSITAPSTFAFGNLEINAGGTVQLQIDITVAGTFTLTAGIFDVTTPANYGVKLLGDVVSNGATFQPRTGTVTLAGAGTQTISGSSQFQVYDLLDINSISISVTGLVSISDILTVSAGSFKTNGSGTVVLTATGPTTYARIAPLGAGAILAGTGWIVQSYIDGPATAYWQYLSTPIKNNQLSDWDNDTRFYMSGVGGNDGNACCP
ncbi:MAG TPA: hypothetical protein VFU15_16965, partial [Bacteroidia bacterium]|nr:hypothetical protein [Bacteroidia bacterium]